MRIPTTPSKVMLLVGVFDIRFPQDYFSTEQVMRLTNPRLASITRRGVRQMRSVRALFGL